MTPAVRQIARQVLPHFGLEEHEPEWLVEHRREKGRAEARAVAMWVARRVFGRSYPELGREFGNRDHTTCMAAVRKVDRCIAKDPNGRIANAALSVLLDAGDMRPGVVKVPAKEEIPDLVSVVGAAE
jgi:chromosomal replication initiation ATPase DnaA